MPISKKISIIIPVYNEELNVLKIYEEISLVLSNYIEFELIFVEDGSKDSTYEKLRIIQKKDLRVKIIKNSSNFGQSFSIHRGIKDSNFDDVVTLDGDGQNDPKDIIFLLEAYFNNIDLKLVGGIRRKRKDKYSKIIASKIANYIRSMILKDGCEDTGCSLKVFNKNIFLKFPFFNGMHRFLPALFTGFGYTVKYIDVNHRPRESGKSKYGNTSRFFRGIRDLIKVIIILNKRKKLR